jgi:hypothetical protein
MGEVYRARDTRLGRDVALKLVRPEQAGDSAARERFLRGARAAAVLTPPGVAAAFVVNLSYSGSLGEEPGLARGVAAPAPAAGGPLAASLTIGVWWAQWPAPIDPAQAHGLHGIGALPVRLVLTVPLSLLFTWVTTHAGGNLLPAFALHTTVNAVPDFAMRDPARYEHAMRLYLLIVVVLGVAVSLVDRQLLHFTPGELDRKARPG